MYFGLTDRMCTTSFLFHDEAKKAEWNNFQDIKNQFRSASIVGNDRIVFNIKGNDYRLIVLILFLNGKIFIRFVGTHKLSLNMIRELHEKLKIPAEILIAAY